MTAPIGLQLYSVREYLARDFEGVMKRIAKMGYAGVETWKFPEGLDPKDAKKIFDDLSLTVTSTHSPLPLGDDKQKVLDTLEAINCPHLVSAWMDPDYYSSEDKMKGLAEIFNQAAAVAAENGMKFSIHNHDFEFAQFNGSPAIYTLMEYLEPGINFELDTYWIKVAGTDPAEVVTKMGHRSPLIHIKDGTATKDGDMTAAGDGVIDIPSIIKAGEPITEWLIVEIDRCATDMMEAIEKSCQYLTQLSD